MAFTRETNLVLEGFCIIICILVVLYVFIDKKNKARGWFGKLAFANIGMLLGDMSDYAFSGTPGVFMHYFLIAGSYLFYVSSALVLYFCAGYFFDVYKEKGYDILPGAYLMAKIFCGLHVLFTTISLFTGIIFYIDVNNVYRRGPMNWLCYVSFPIYLLIFYVAFRNIKKTPVREFCIMQSFIIIPIIGQVLQFSTYGLALLPPSITLAIILGLMFIQMQNQLQNNIDRRKNLEKQNENLALLRNQQDSFVSEIITVLGRSIEAKDEYTQGHSSRVANYTREMIYRLGGTKEEQIQAYYVGLLHDIGKLRIPDTIINKNGKLDDNEYEMIKVHTVAGYHILKEIKSMPEIYEGARWHHERYDGKGYPNGLAGEEIPFLARVIAVADAYDAMTSRRSYHDTMPQAKVRAEIEKGRGTQFDPEIADVMLQMIDEDINYDMRQYQDISHRRILLIDDDEIVHTQVKTALEGERFIITSVFSGEQGIEALGEEEYDLCLIDLQMPGMDGLEVAEWIFKNRRRLKTILFTGDKEIDIIRKAVDLGIKDYVTKPLRPMVLKESIKSVLMH